MAVAAYRKSALIIIIIIIIRCQAEPKFSSFRFVFVLWPLPIMCYSCYCRRLMRNENGTGSVEMIIRGHWCTAESLSRSHKWHAIKTKTTHWAKWSAKMAEKNAKIYDMQISSDRDKNIVLTSKKQRPICRFREKIESLRKQFFCCLLLVDYLGWLASHVFTNNLLHTAERK